MATEQTPQIIVSPLKNLNITAAKYDCQQMVSLLRKEQKLKRPLTINQEDHLLIDVNDITKATHDLILPNENHVKTLIEFIQGWQQAKPLLIHCWMGVSRSPACAFIAANVLYPETSPEAHAQRLRKVAPFATPNSLLVEVADRMLEKNGSMTDAIKAIGRGAEISQGYAFSYPLCD